MAALRGFTDRRDMRDATILGEALLDLPRRLKTLARRYDRHRVAMLAIPDFADATTPLDRYGDPVAKHEAAIEAGLAVRMS